jgi:hypothetical protein
VGGRRIEATIPQVMRLLHLPPIDDLSVTVGREMRECRDRITGLESAGEASRPAANMIFGHAETACTPSRPSSSQHSAGS